MIVISGALVLVALVLLIIGVVGPDLTFVYASIAVSLVSLVFLVIGILQRRGETAPAADAATAQSSADDQSEDSLTAVIPAQASRSGAVQGDEPAPVADTVDEELETGGTVLIVEGRPRYHVEGCRYLSNKAAEKIDVLDAREEGFTPCGVCKPDDELEARDADEQELLLDQAEPADEVEPAQDEPAVDVAPVRTAPARKPAARKAPAKKAPATKSAAGKATSTRTVAAAPARASSAAASKAASKAAVAAVAATPAAAAARKTGSVVVIPDRGKFHRAECRYVRDVDGAETLSKSAASRQGYAACGVCKP